MLILAMLLSAVSFAEELGEIELSAPEGYVGLYAAGVPTVALTNTRTTAKMDVDDMLQIVVNDGETGIFTSKSAKLASVDANGLVTALAKGTATIEFKPEDGKKRTLSVKISDPYEPTGVSIGQGKTATLNVGETLQLNAALAPETARAALTWKSSKPQAASVDGDGLVKALSEGKAKLTVTTANKKKAAITVTVKDPYKPTGVRIGQGKTATVNVGDTLRLDAALLPETARTVLTWKSSKPKTAEVDGDGLVTALSEGKATITVTTSNKKKATIALTVVDPYKPTGVRIEQGKTAMLDVGETLQLDAVLAPETARTVLTWKSSKPKVVEVDDDGLVTALSDGKATVTVTTSNKKKATIALTVVDPYKPTGVTIEQGKTATLDVDETLQLDAVLAPETAQTVLKWNSSKPKVAEVDDDGLVTALSDGKATITVTTSNNKKATFTLTVVDPYKPTGVRIDQGRSATLDVGETLQLDATLVPDIARADLTWKSSKPKVAEVDDGGYVTALARGTAKITVTTHNGKSATLELEVIDDSFVPISSNLIAATYEGLSYNIVNTAIDPFTYADLVYDNVCTHPGGTDEYSGYCLTFCNFYVSGMVDGLTDADVRTAKRKSRSSKQLKYKTEKYSDPDEMMARLYDLLNEGVPQTVMVEAILHPGSRHFVVAVGYRSSVTRRDALRPEDLLVIDSFDGRLESMDPKIDPVDTRSLFKQSGKYRIEAAWYK